VLGCWANKPKTNPTSQYPTFTQQLGWVTNLDENKKIEEVRLINNFKSEY
jgi:hypothetical protein